MFKTGIRIIADIGPLCVLFVANKFYDFFTSISLFMVAVTVAVIASWIYEGRTPLFPFIFGLFVVTFGGASVWLQNSDIIMVADSLYYGIGAGVLGITYWFKKPILKTLFKDIFALHNAGWRILTLRWCLLFALIALLNELFRIFSTPEIWIDFKFYKSFLIIAFGLYQFKIASDYRIIPESNRFGLRTHVSPTRS